MNSPVQTKTVIDRSPAPGQLPPSPLKQNKKQPEVQEVDVEQQALSDRIKEEFKIRFDNLEKDIEHIDNRMSHIQQFCTNLDAQVQNLQQLVKSDNNPGKKGQYYQIMNSCMELNANYEMLYIRCMELKQRYRKEQDDLHSKLSKFTEVEIPKAKVDTTGQALTPASLALMMQELTKAINTNDKKAEGVHASLQELQEDPDYKL